MGFRRIVPRHRITSSTPPHTLGASTKVSFVGVEAKEAFGFIQGGDKSVIFAHRVEAASLLGMAKCMVEATEAEDVADFKELSLVESHSCPVRVMTCERVKLEREAVGQAVSLSCTE